MIKHPNIVMIFCDELRKDGLSIYKPVNDKITTPHIESIAENGITFDSCYCISPVCVPSRTSLMTGMAPNETGVYHNESMLPQVKVKPVKTLTSVLEDNGYITVNFGKTHLANGVQGFSIDDSSGSEQSYPQLIEDELSPKGQFHSIVGGIESEYEYIPDRVTKNAINWIEKNNDVDPFFLRISYLQPHTPVVVKKDFATYYSEKEFILPDVENISHSDLSEFEKAFSEMTELDTLNKTEIAKLRMYYYNLIAWIDEQVGLIIKSLKENNLFDDTIIIFSSDHGANKAENGWLGKQLFSYHSHSIPLIISHHSKLEKNVRNSHLTSTIDISKMILELANIEEIPEQFSGINTLAKNQKYIYSIIGYGDKRSRAFPLKGFGAYTHGRGWPRRACIRTENYRLDMNVKIDGEIQLNDKEKDIFFVDRTICPNENRNMINKKEYQDIINQLKEKLEDNFSKMVEFDDKDINAIYDLLESKERKNITL